MLQRVVAVTVAYAVVVKRLALYILQHYVGIRNTLRGAYGAHTTIYNDLSRGAYSAKQHNN